MDIKKYKYTLIFASIVLTACGGGGNSDTSYTASDGLDTLYQVYYQQFSPSLMISQDFFGLSQYPINNKIIKFSDSSQTLNQYVLTQNKLFQPTEKQDAYLTINDDIWTYQYLPDVLLQLKIKKIDLSGTNIFDRLLPGYREYGNFPDRPTSDTNLNLTLTKLFNNHGQKNFPQGSLCYQVVETQWNKNYLQFDSSNNNAYFDPTQSDFLSKKAQEKEYIDYINNIFAQPYYALREGTWNNIAWFASEVLLASKFGQYSSHVYFSQYHYDALYNSNALWTQENELKGYTPQEIDPTDSPTTQQIIRELNIQHAELKDGCFAYNQTAYNTIKNLNGIDFKTFSQPTSSFFFGKRIYSWNQKDGVIIQ
ncbi:hypothetical protein [Acinetobacter populi]|uniref:Lipoprotein n=1 Tax=Acinetobacter populi TaxID=1582270 RepID=A0A1Z9YYE8_9GAMM|nr:hypothetical protein [Acinetobacter populi]OUY07192.1 hypothetical protein CAP51_10955 [Acinetobacter populi]